MNEAAVHAVPTRAELQKAGMQDVPFDWADALRFDDLLTAEEVMVRDSARAYAQERLMPRILMAHRHETFDVAVMREMAGLGFLGATIQGFGCAASVM